MSEGRLDPRSWWYITETVIYHLSKLTQQGRPPWHFVGQERRRCRAAQRPGPRELRKRRAVSRNSAAGPGGPDGLRHDEACYPGKHGNRLVLAADSSRPQSRPGTGPVFLASDLNPHEATPAADRRGHRVQPQTARRTRWPHDRRHRPRPPGSRGALFDPCLASVWTVDSRLGGQFILLPVRPTLRQVGATFV